MGYVAKPVGINIRFEDEPGLLIRAHSVPLGVLLEVADAAAEVDAEALEALAATPGALRGALAGMLGTLLGTFLGAVDSWNLEYPEGVPTPISLEGVLSLPDPGLIMRALQHWQKAMTQVRGDSPLPKPSTNGATLEEGLLPMAQL